MSPYSRFSQCSGRHYKHNDIGEKNPYTGKISVACSWKNKYASQPGASPVSQTSRSAARASGQRAAASRPAHGPVNAADQAAAPPRTCCHLVSDSETMTLNGPARWHPSDPETARRCRGAVTGHHGGRGHRWSRGPASETPGAHGRQ